MLVSVLLFTGLLLWALCDAYTHSVPAWPFEAWCGVLLALLLIGTSRPWWPPLLSGLTFALLARRGWVGAADAWLIAVLAAYFPFERLLWLLLIASLTGIGHAGLAHSRTLPWLPHLAAAATIVAAWPT